MNTPSEQPSCVVCDQEIRRLEERVAEAEGLERAEALMSLADAAYFAGRWELALTAVGACLDLLPPGESPQREAEAERKSACALAGLNRFEEASQHADRAREIYSSLGEHRGVASCVTIQGRLALDLGRSDEGIELLEAAAESLRRLDCIEEASQCHLAIARELENRYDPAALQHFDTARDGFAATGLAVLVATCQKEAGLALASARNMEREALDRLTEAAIIFEACGEPLDEAECENEAGTMLTRLRRPKEALELHKRSRPVLAELGAPEAVAKCDMNWGVALKDLGRSKQAAAKLRSALRAFRKLGQEVEVAACEDYLGMALQALGEYEKAVDHHRRAIETFERHGMTRDVAMCEHYLEIALDHLEGQNAPPEQSEAYGRVIPLRRKSKR